jgi:anionic cell wall polymer biosynthesis LytR-Cps2A-Psr (LCP) family protein
MNRKLKFFLIFLGVVIVSFGVYRFFPKSFSAINSVPQEFTDANQNATLISQKIVDFSNTAAADLAKINDLDSQGKYVDALNLTSEAFDQNLQMRNQAVALSDELGKMTRALSQVASFEARQSALESISDRLALVNKLITAIISISFFWI